MQVSGAYIAGVDYALPARRVGNDELAHLHPEWKMTQVAMRSGVQSRHWSGPGETALDLAEVACRKLLDRKCAELGKVNALLFCTQSPDYVMPPNACLLQHRLGLPRTVAALDYTLACSGFVYGLYLAKALIGAGMAEHVLLVTAETYSKWINPDDRGPSTLFGDGAATTLISAGEASIGGFVLGTDGGGASGFMVPAGGARFPRSSETALLTRDPSGNIRSAENLYMNGQAVLDFVKKEIPALVYRLLEQEKLTLDELDLVIFHQASQVALDFLSNALRIPPIKQFNNMANVGNSVSASIPIALRDAELQGKLKPGMRVMLIGFGVGLSWGGCIVNWRKGNS
jgi:3-oxoacyl-[acyl-carrier-protein] synthase III